VSDLVYSYYINYLTVYCFLRVLATIFLSVKISRYRQKDNIKQTEIRCKYLRMASTASGHDKMADIWEHGDEI